MDNYINRLGLELWNLDRNKNKKKVNIKTVSNIHES